MATILPFPVKKAAPLRGLTEQECDAIQAAAYDLMIQGRVAGIGIHNDGQYMWVFDGNGEPYSIGRETGVCYLTNHEETMLVHNRRFLFVLQALQIPLTSKSDGVA